MANDGSISCALRNSFAALGYSKLCNWASPRRNGSCAAGAPELAKATTPTSSCAAPAVNAMKSARSVTRERMGAYRTLFALSTTSYLEGFSLPALRVAPQLDCASIVHEVFAGSGYGHPETSGDVY